MQIYRYLFITIQFTKSWRKSIINMYNYVGSDWFNYTK